MARVLTAEHKAKISASVSAYLLRRFETRPGHMTGKTHSAESRAKTSASLHRAIAEGRRQVRGQIQHDVGPCEICNQTKNLSLRQDHCHTTGKQRGKICHSCNVALGLFGDDPSIMRAAADYVEGYR